MPKLRLKVKHLLLILLMVSIILWGQSFISSQLLLSRGESYLSNGQDEQGVAYLRKYIQEFPERKKALSAFEEILNEIPKTDTFSVFLGHGSSRGEILTLADLEKLEHLNRDFQQLKEYHQGEEILKLQLNLAEVNFQANNVRKTKELIKEVIYLEKPAISNQATLLLTLLHLDLGEVEKARELYNQSNSGLKFLQQAGKWMDLFDGNIESIIEKDLNKVIHSSRYNYNNWTRKYSNTEILKMIYQNLKAGETNLGGYVKKGDQPLANAVVFLQEKKDDFMSPYYSSLEGMADYLAISDENGYYEFKGIEPGEYFIGVGIAYQRVDGFLYNPPQDIIIEDDTLVERNLEFIPAIEIVDAPELKEIDEFISFKLSWEPYPGASYYKVYIGFSDEGGTFVPFKGEKIFATETTVELAPEFFYTPGGISMSSEGISPASIIGYEKIPIKIVYGVDAYDENGQNLSRIIDPLQRYSFNWLGKGELNKGDKLLIERKYEDAIEAYEEMISSGSRDEDVLKALGRLYHHGYKYKENNILGQDYEKARKYLTEAYQIGKDSSLLSYLRGLAIRAGDWELAENYLEISLEEDPDNGWLRFNKGQLELYQGNLLDAEKHLRKSVEETGSNQEYLILTYLLLGRKEEALLVEDKYPAKYDRYYDYSFTDSLKDCYSVLNWDELEEFFLLLNSGQVNKALDTLSLESETGRFYDALSLVLKPRSWMSEDFYEAYHCQENPALKEFIKIIGKELINSDFPHKME